MSMRLGILVQMVILTACGEPQAVSTGRFEAARNWCAAVATYEEAAAQARRADQDYRAFIDGFLEPALSEASTAGAGFDAAAELYIALFGDEQIKRRYARALERRDVARARLLSLYVREDSLATVRSFEAARFDHVQQILRERAFADSASNHSGTVADSAKYSAMKAEASNVMALRLSDDDLVGRAVSEWASERIMAILADADAYCSVGDLIAVDAAAHAALEVN
jgi:hypothetical protein